MSEETIDSFDEFDEEIPSSEGSFAAIMNSNEMAKVIHVKGEEETPEEEQLRKAFVDKRNRIIFHCRECESRLVAKAIQQGKKLRCPSCKTVQSVPQLIGSREDFMRGSDPSASLMGVYMGKGNGMAHVIRCPSCWSKMPVHDHVLGKKIACPKCSCVFRIPFPPISGEEISEDEITEWMGED